MENNIDLNEIIIIDKNSPYVPNVINLENKVFWNWFINQIELLKQIEWSSLKGITNAIWIINKEKELIWFWICYMWWNWSREEVEIDNKFKDLSQIAYIKTIIISPEYQWKALWGVLIENLITNSKKVWNTSLLLHAWDGSPNNSSINFFEKHWAKQIKRYDKKWYEDSLKNWWSCSKCGNPCLCSSIEMIIKL